ncbi:hypothetical protein FKP32DRAFT_260188 [Trametes sanguinea]|nr:hypothetical protein FKP32DRAFT_260188 [Trametes sanguinea]
MDVEAVAVTPTRMLPSTVNSSKFMTCGLRGSRKAIGNTSESWKQEIYGSGYGPLLSPNAGPRAGIVGVLRPARAMRCRPRGWKKAIIIVSEEKCYCNPGSEGPHAAIDVAGSHICIKPLHTGYLASYSGFQPTVTSSPDSCAFVCSFNEGPLGISYTTRR